MEKKTNRETKKIVRGQENLTSLLKEKDQEARIAKQKAGFFARKQAELSTKSEKTTNASGEEKESE